MAGGRVTRTGCRLAVGAGAVFLGLTAKGVGIAGLIKASASTAAPFFLANRRRIHVLLLVGVKITGEVAPKVIRSEV